jgi:hypothetical protein
MSHPTNDPDDWTVSRDRSAAPTGATPNHDAAGTRPSDAQPLPPAPGGYAPRSPDAPGPAAAPTAPIPSAGAPVAKRGKATPILAALTVLLFLALAAMTGLFLINNNSSDETIASQKSQIGTLQREAKAQDDELGKAKQDLATAKSQAEAAQKKAQSAAACSKAVQEFFNAVKVDNEAAGTRAALTIERDCEGVNVF